MRWFWIDRFTVFESGRRAEAVKAVTMTEEQIDEYFPGFPMLSPCFVLEGFAQMGGLLVCEQSDFRANVVLAKIAKSRIHTVARPGDVLTYRVEGHSLQPDGGLITATSHIGDRLHVEAELTFAQVTREQVDRQFFEPQGLLRMLRVYRLFDVGVDANGERLKIPPHMLAAEQAGIIQ